MIKFGLIGTGKMAAAIMDAFKHLPDAKVVAVASESAERAQNFALNFNIPTSYGTLADLLSDKSIDAVYIANATENHANATILALKAGKAVLCEKPIATSEAECKEIELAAKQSGKLCMEAMWTHFLPAYQRMFELSHDTSIGKPIHLYADFGYTANKETQPRLYAQSPGSGVLLDRGVYPIALSIKLFGTIESVSAKILYDNEGIDVHANLLLQHKNGCYSQLSTSIASLLQNRAVLSFSNGSISLEPPVIGAETLSLHRFTPDTTPQTSAPSFKAKIKDILRQSSFLRRINSKKNAGHREYHHFGKNQYLPVLQHFSALYSAGAKQSDVIPLSFSCNVLHVIELAKKSSKANS